MPKTDASPLSIVQKQAEVTKKAVDKLLKECNKVIKDKKLKDKDVKQKQLFKECFQLKKDVISVYGRAEKLTKEDEPKKVKNYDNKRDFEVKRVANLQNQLTMIMPKLAPDEDEEAFTKELKEAGEISDAPVNEDEEEEEGEESQEEDEVDNAVEENQEEVKDGPKDDKKDKKGKDKDKDKKGKDKDKKDKDKKGKEKDKKKKDKKDKDDEDDDDDDDDDDEEVDDKDIKAKDKKSKDKDKDAKSKDKKEKDKKDKKKKNEDDYDDDEDKKKNKDKKKDEDKKDKKEKDKNEKKNKKDKVETPKPEIKDLEEESEEDDEDDDIEEAIEGDDEDDFEDTEEEDEEDDHAIIQSKRDMKQVQAKHSPKDETDNLKTMDYEDEESEEEEESDDDEVEDLIQPEKAKVIASTPKPASRTLVSKSESASSTSVVTSSSSTSKADSSNIISSTSQSKTPQPASRSSTSKATASSSKEVSKIESKKDEADHEDEEEDSEDEEEEEEKESEEEEDVEEEESEEEEDDDDDEEEESEEEDTTKADDTLEVTQGIERFVAIDDFDAVEEGDLSVKKDEVIRIIEVREDGWWMAENDEGKQGLVPKTYLKVYNQYKSIQQDDEEEEKENGGDSEEEGEEKQDGGKTPTSKRRSGRELWGSLKKTVTETLVTDVLHAMGAGPPGFRLPTLSKYFNESEKFRMKNFLAPKLSESNLGYRDLLFNPATGEMRPVEVRLERVITITSCQQIPPPATGIIVQRRYVRMCLFDGQNVLSNIHTVRVAAEDKTERNWSFNSKISDMMDVQLHNEFFIRSNSTHSNIGILFELCISCVKTVNEKSEERGEFSCGWVHLPLTDKTGVPIANKNYDLYVHGGTPYERDVEVDPSVSRRASSNALVSLISGNKQPRLLVKVSVPNKDQKTHLDLLPEILVGDMCLLPFYTYYRQILADALVIKRLDLDSTEAIHSPLLRQFPEVADHPDLMSLFRETWVQKLKAVKRAEKRDVEAMKGIFDKVFKESVYPVITTSNFVSYKTGNTEIETKRRNVIEKFSQIKRERKSALAALLASDIVYTPFDMSEVTFNIINPYSLVDKFIPIPVES